MLGEAAQDPAVDGSEHAIEIEFDDGHARLPSPSWKNWKS
jgi:hypothetical protein